MSTPQSQVRTKDQRSLLLTRLTRHFPSREESSLQWVPHNQPKRIIRALRITQLSLRAEPFESWLLRIVQSS